MQPARIARRRLDRVPESVAEVEEGAFTVLVLVASDDLRLDFAGSADHMLKRLGVAREQRIDMRFEPRKQERIADQAVFDDLGKPGDELALWQRCERLDIDDDGTRLVKCADEILASRMVHAGLAAYRGIHLRE